MVADLVRMTGAKVPPSQSVPKISEMMDRVHTWTAQYPGLNYILDFENKILNELGSLAPESTSQAFQDFKTFLSNLFSSSDVYFQFPGITPDALNAFCNQVLEESPLAAPIATALDQTMAKLVNFETPPCPLFQTIIHTIITKTDPNWNNPQTIAQKLFEDNFWSKFHTTTQKEIDFLQSLTGAKAPAKLSPPTIYSDSINHWGSTPPASSGKVQDAKNQIVILLLNEIGTLLARQPPGTSQDLIDFFQKNVLDNFISKFPPATDPAELKQLAECAIFGIAPPPF